MSARLLVPVLSLFCLATACNQLPKRRGESVVPGSSSTLEQRSPIEVAVAPISDSSGNAELPRGDLRRAFQAALLERRYTPISLDLVDSKVVDAAYRPGSLDENAVLLVDVQRWDTHLWDTRDVIEVTIQARMVDPSSPSSNLWSGVLEKRFDFSNSGDLYSTSSALWRHACQTIASELLEAMPARQPVPGRATP
ncbi:MAG: hypothetical protein IPJ19_01135 [Planctomycetes bacterium]|nr:hypothetical protein [Planctomycetota bacterium]